MKEQENKKLKYIIVVLVVLIAVSSTALAATQTVRYLRQREAVSVEVPGNIITPDSEDSSWAETDPSWYEFRDDETSGQSNAPESSERLETAPASKIETESVTAGAVSASGRKASAIALYNRKPEENARFYVTDMFPGDTQTEEYRVKVSYKDDVVVRYHASVRKGYEKLGEALQIRVCLLDTELYDGPIDDMPESLQIPLYTDASARSELYYDITAYLDTSAGNEYQNLELIADFRWWVEEIGHLEAPYTGDILTLYPWIGIASVSLLLLLILLKKRGKETNDEVE